MLLHDLLILLKLIQNYVIYHTNSFLTLLTLKLEFNYLFFKHFLIIVMPYNVFIIYLILKLLLLVEYFICILILIKLVYHPMYLSLIFFIKPLLKSHTFLDFYDEIILFSYLFYLIYILDQILMKYLMKNILIILN